MLKNCHGSKFNLQSEPRKNTPLYFSFVAIWPQILLGKYSHISIFSAHNLKNMQNSWFKGKWEQHPSHLPKLLQAGTLFVQAFGQGALKPCSIPWPSWQVAEWLWTCANAHAFRVKNFFFLLKCARHGAGSSPSWAGLSGTSSESRISSSGFSSSVSISSMAAVAPHLGELRFKMAEVLCVHDYKPSLAPRGKITAATAGTMRNPKVW